MMDVCLSVDVESDCPPYLSGFRGVTEGLPRLLVLLDQLGIDATFFVTGDVARRHPEAVRAIVHAGHELGSHGDTHRSFAGLAADDALGELEGSMAVLSRFAEVASFRAPYLRLPPEHLSLVARAGYRIDSSGARYKQRREREAEHPGLARVPVSVTSSVLRLPRCVRRPWLDRLRSPVILFLHPWELVDLRRTALRLDCRFRTGDAALQALAQCLRWFCRRGAHFQRIRDLVPPTRAC